MICYKVYYSILCYSTPNLPTNIVDFRGFDSSQISSLRGGILMSIGNSPESLSPAMLVGVMLVGGLGVARALAIASVSGRCPPAPGASPCAREACGK